MREIGGYIELDKFNGTMLHEDGILLNCGRSCLKYLIRARQIKKILLPYFCCDSVSEACQQEGLEVRYFHINKNWIPQNVKLAENEYLYVVNYYGQLNKSTIEELNRQYKRIILDETQNYFSEPIKGIDTIYTCRKFFGVADGGILYTDVKLNQDFSTDESFDRMNFLLGRFERTASEFYGEYVANNEYFSNKPVKKMSKLTKNLLHALDYDFICNRRTKNFIQLHDAFININKLSLKVPNGAFAYPLLIDDGAKMRKQLISQKIYIPKLWPEVRGDFESNLADNILPLPIDQRYGCDDMNYLIKKVLFLIRGGGVTDFYCIFPHFNYCYGGAVA